MTTKEAWEPEEPGEEEESTAPMSVQSQQKKGRGGIYDLPDLPTTSAVLIDSDHHDYGEIRVVVDLFGTNYKEGELIGSWTKVPFDNLVHIDFTTPLDALRDKGIQRSALYVKKRAAKKAGKPVPEDDSGVIETEFNDLRAKLKAAMAG